MDFKGQISIEYMFLIGFTLIISILVFSYAVDANELNTAISAARNGALDGANIDSFAIYSELKFKEYEIKKPLLLQASTIKIVKIAYVNQGYSNIYKKTKIMLIIYASTTRVLGYDEKNSLGDRINYNARKSITECFKTHNLTNDFYNPAFSDRYIFTTADVKWL